MMRNLFSYLVIIGCSIVIAGCGSRNVVYSEPEVEFVSGTAGSTTGLSDDAITTSGLGDGNSNDSASGVNTYGDLLGMRVVYFEYNSSLLSLASEAIAQAHAKSLASASGVQVILEGHADERGTREYNLALGESRARSVANVMEALGVSVSRIQIVSYGEERPVAFGYDEAAFALNRRVEIVYQ